MSRADWFRRTEWNDEVERDFFVRLARSRSQFHRAQYLRIQALELIQAGGSHRLRKALDLLDLLISRHPEPFELPGAHKQRGQALAELGDVDGALAALRDSMKAETQRPSRVAAHLDFGMLVVATKREELYAEALRALEEFGGHELMPYMKYEAGVIRAIALNKARLHDAARDQARRALEEAAKTHSGFRYHPTVGLVRIKDRELHERVVELAQLNSRM